MNNMTMLRSRSGAIGVVFLAAFLVSVPTVSPGAVPDGNADQASVNEQGWDNVTSIVVRGHNLDVDRLRSVYEENENRPLWQGGLAQGEAVLEAVRRAHLHGLSPYSYHVDALTAVLADDGDGRLRAGVSELPTALTLSSNLERELLLTAIVARFVQDIHVGRLAPRSIDADFDYDRREIDVAQAVREVSLSSDPGREMMAFAPNHDGYDDLVAILQEFRSLARQGGWPEIEEGGVIRPGGRDSRLPVLRERLAISGDYRAPPEGAGSLPPAFSFGGDSNSQTRSDGSARGEVSDPGRSASRFRQEIRSNGGTDGGNDHLSASEVGNIELAVAISEAYQNFELSNNNDPEFFDPYLVAAVESFQGRHGLTVDGIIGPKTFEALNVSVEERIKQVIAGLERWRWLPADLAEGYGRYIMVNIADFSLDIVEDGQRIKRMATIVGRPSRQTPLFSSRMTWLEFNPTWTIPTSIAVQDMLPNILNDPDYFFRQGITVYDGWGHGASAIDDRDVDWERLGSGIRGYRLVQAPGPQNALGKVKFMMANSFSVYLHDTPSRHLFTRSQRAYSSGCIRVEDPMWLADFVMGEQAGWQALRNRTQADWQTRRVNLDHHIPVHLAYNTAWRDGDGVVQIRGDIYGIDQVIAESLIGQGSEGDHYAFVMP